VIATAGRSALGLQWLRSWYRRKVLMVFVPSLAPETEPVMTIRAVKTCVRLPITNEGQRVLRE
jgi:hypothetical protein